MTRRKRERMADVTDFPNVFEVGVDIKGKWHDTYFKNNYPITLELACGKGEYTIELARRFPKKNFIGVDIKGDRLWVGAKTALEENLKTAAFLRLRIEYLARFFAQSEVGEIWVTFPDPYPENGDENKRLMSPPFLNIYRELLKEKGVIHLKTDELNLFFYTLEILNAEDCHVHKVIEDLYKTPVEDDRLMIKTTYERRYLEKERTIKYISFSF